MKGEVYIGGGQLGSGGGRWVRAGNDGVPTDADLERPMCSVCGKRCGARLGEVCQRVRVERGGASLRFPDGVEKRVDERAGRRLAMRQALAERR